MIWPFGRKKDGTEVAGDLGCFGLGDWWLSTFTEAERTHIEQTYRPLGMSRPCPLTRGEIAGTTQTAAGLLWGLASWFQRPQDRHIARRLVAKAEEMAGSDVLDRHFSYQAMIQTYYADRDADPTALKTALDACEKQIALAPRAAKAFERKWPNAPLPAHLGFSQLAIVREKQRHYAEAMELSNEALRQGWNGDWEKRIARCEEKSLKQIRKGR